MIERPVLRKSAGLCDGIRLSGSEPRMGLFRSLRCAVVAVLVLITPPLRATVWADTSSDPPASSTHTPHPPTSDANDVAAARALFRANLEAIRRRDRAAYLACYLDSDWLARTGPTGPRLGFKTLVGETSKNEWPDHFDASDLQLVPIREGLVYGTYRYRVRYGMDEQSGLSERLFLRTSRGWRIAVTTAFTAPAGTPPPPKALVGATLIDGTGSKPVPDAIVVLRAGKIEYAGPRSHYRLPAGIETLDVGGLGITPGLVDAHVHYSQTGWADGRPDALDLRARYPYAEVEKRLRSHPERFHRCYLCSGVTAVFDVGGYPWTLDLQEATKDDTFAPHLAAAGPLLSTIDFWLNLPAERQFIYLADEAAARMAVGYLAARGAAAVKVWFIPDPARDFGGMSRIVEAVGAEARKRGLQLIVHATGLREAKAALRAGARVLVHSVEDAPVDDEFIRLARQNGTIYCPTLTVRGGYARLFECARSGKNGHAPSIDDPNGCVDEETKGLIASTPKVTAELVRPEILASRNVGRDDGRTMAANLKRVHDAGIPVAMGTDAGNPFTLHGPSVYAEMEAMQSAGLRPLEVLQAATRGGAMAMGRLSEFGTVEVGKDADLLVVAADPAADIANLRRLRYVIRGGVVRALDELRPVTTRPR